MGCCMSTPKPPHQHFSNGRERAPPSMEEDAIVKEVLSETPNPKPSIAIAKLEPQKLTSTTTSSVLATAKPEIQKKLKPPVRVVEEAEISEVSEICTVSECVSTTTVTESRDGDGEVKQRVLLDISPAEKFPRYRSFSGDMTGNNRNRTVNRSPARRSDPSPGKRNDVSLRSGNQQTRRRMVTNHARRDPGESSGRRSRSPATRNTEAGGRSVMGRSQSTGKTGQSPGRVKKNNNADFECGNGKDQGKWANTPNESLENPLVSLECFIFL